MDHSITDIGVLMVDDQPVMLDVYTQILDIPGITLHTALSAAKAFKVLKKNKVDIICTDILMPEMDGIEFAKILDNDIVNRKVIIFFTCLSDRNFIHECKRSVKNNVFGGYIYKFAGIDIIIEIVEKFAYQIRNNLLSCQY